MPVRAALDNGQIYHFGSDDVFDYFADIWISTNEHYREVDAKRHAAIPDRLKEFVGTIPADHNGARIYDLKNLQERTAGGSTQRSSPPPQVQQEADNRMKQPPVATVTHLVVPRTQISLWDTCNN